MQLSARASGKVVLLGDYVVLEGAPALSAAVPIAAAAHFVPACQAGSFLVVARPLGLVWRGSVASEAARTAARASAPSGLALVVQALASFAEHAAVPLPGGELTVDTHAFYSGEHKLGLGSSAAVLVAVLRVLQQALEAAGQGGRAAGLCEAITWHRAWQQGRGSGIDVATSWLGGVVRFQREVRGFAVPHVHTDEPEAVALAMADSEAASRQVPRGPHAVRLRVEPALAWAVISAGRSSSTRAALLAAERYKQSSPAGYWHHMEQLAHLSQAACEFWQLSATTAFLPLVDQARAVLQSLGEQMDWPIVSAEHRAIASKVAALGGAYKPSGAGGGDVGVAFFAERRSLGDLARSLRATPFSVVAQMPSH